MGVGRGPPPAAGAGLDARWGLPAREVLSPGDVRYEPVSRWTTKSIRGRCPPTGAVTDSQSVKAYSVIGADSLNFEFETEGYSIVGYEGNSTEG